jgi:hypothetical protein
MRRPTGEVVNWTFVKAVLLLVCWIVISAVAAGAQQGQNAVYNPTGSPTNSPAFIDASMFASSASNICAVLYGILSSNFTSYPPAGAVIDARGLNSGNTSMTCATGTTPWNNGSTYQNVPSTILLPATGGATPDPIVIHSTWVVPSDTHLIGEGDGTPSSSFFTGTTIRAASGFSGSMIQFGSNSSVCPQVESVYICTGIAVENLTLDGQGQLPQTVSGIANTASQAGSYVNHVSLYRILGTGLSVSGNANNSGPYSKITFDLGGNLGTLNTVCASIRGLNSTRGIHGVWA